MRLLRKNRKGFTLIELIVVLAILAILSAILIPSISNYIHSAKDVTDQSSVRTLNSLTVLYGIDNNVLDGDIFSGFNTDEQRMNELVNEGYLSNIVEPELEDSEFIWSIEYQRWLNNSLAIALPPSNKYLFSEMLKSDFIFSTWAGVGGLTWSINENGLSSTGTGNNDLLFIQNNMEEYTLSTNFKLNSNPGTYGGMGVLFETSLNDTNGNKDTGFILQFDRGWSEIVLRRRVDGRETNASDMLLARIGNASTSTIKNASIPNRTNSAWWESEKELTLSVKESETEGIKLLTVYLDGVAVLQDFEIESDIDPINNHTGFRTWNNQPATIYDLNVEGTSE
jgi:prepilin-type N-terminal cleavage/methylation domain-containing protein